MIVSVTAFQRVQRLNWRIRLTGLVSVVLIVGALTPWITYSDSDTGDEYVSGIDFIAGLLTILIGVSVIALLTSLHRRGRNGDAGAVAALALLACGVMAATGIRYHQQDYSLGWGFWITAGASLSLLLTGLLLMGEHDEALGPPD
jgi:drug/metabolite transporter (DMT)-like permease